MPAILFQLLSHLTFYQIYKFISLCRHDRRLYKPVQTGHQYALMPTVLICWTSNKKRRNQQNKMHLNPVILGRLSIQILYHYLNWIYRKWLVKGNSAKHGTNRSSNKKRRSQEAHNTHRKLKINKHDVNRFHQVLGFQPLNIIFGNTSITSIAFIEIHRLSFDLYSFQRPIQSTTSYCDSTSFTALQHNLNNHDFHSYSW